MPALKSRFIPTFNDDPSRCHVGWYIGASDLLVSEGRRAVWGMADDFAPSIALSSREEAERAIESFAEAGVTDDAGMEGIPAEEFRYLYVRYLKW